jgi:hypothetical protein
MCDFPFGFPAGMTPILRECKWSRGHSWSEGRISVLSALILLLFLPMKATVSL